MCPGWHRFRLRRGGLLSGSERRDGWSGGCGQGAQPLPARQEGVFPGLGQTELEGALRGADQSGGQAPEPVAQRVRLGFLEVVAVVQA